MLSTVEPEQGRQLTYTQMHTDRQTEDRDAIERITLDFNGW